jgi:hypothetical protein
MLNAWVGFAHPERKEIARYLLSRGLDPVELAPAPARIAELLAAAPPIEFPEGLAPQPAPVDPAPLPEDALPRADVVVIAWTMDELAGLAQVLTPGVSPQRCTAIPAISPTTNTKSGPMRRWPRPGGWAATVPPEWAGPAWCASSPSCTLTRMGSKPVRGGPRCRSRTCLGRTSLRCVLRWCSPSGQLAACSMSSNSGMWSSPERLSPAAG